jgi:hypothetical protein
MKQWPEGTRLFTVEAAGSDAKPKQAEFRGDRIVVNL